MLTSMRIFTKLKIRMKAAKRYWSGVRVVEGGGLETRCAARHRGFESPLLRLRLFEF